MIDTATALIVCGAVLAFALIVLAVNVPKRTEALLDEVELALARRSVRRKA
jgi:hypothetical protein